MRSTTSRTFLATVAFAATTFIATAGASQPRRHLDLTKAEPAATATVESPKAVKLWFSEKPVLKNSKITMTGPGGAAVALGKVSLAPAAKSPLVATITGKLAPGAYTVNWMTSAADGHAVNGSFGFTVKEAAVAAKVVAKPAATTKPATPGATAAAKKAAGGGGQR